MRWDGGGVSSCFIPKKLGCPHKNRRSAAIFCPLFSDTSFHLVLTFRYLTSLYVRLQGGWWGFTLSYNSYSNYRLFRSPKPKARRLKGVNGGLLLFLTLRRRAPYFLKEQTTATLHFLDAANFNRKKLTNTNTSITPHFPFITTIITTIIRTTHHYNHHYHSLQRKLNIFLFIIHYHYHSLHHSFETKIHHYHSLQSSISIQPKAIITTFPIRIVCGLAF